MKTLVTIQIEFHQISNFLLKHNRAEKGMDQIVHGQVGKRILGQKPWIG
jgi:hypothetical protein